MTLDSRLTPQDETAIRAITSDHVKAVLAKDWAAWAASLAEDGVVLPPDSGPLHGPAAAVKFLETFPEVTAFSASVDQVGGNGSLAYSRGQGALTLRIDGQPVKATLKFLTVVRKEPDGQWRMIADMWNPGPPV